MRAATNADRLPDRARRPVRGAALQSALDLFGREYRHGTLWLRLAGGAQYRLGRGDPQAAIRLKDEASLRWMLRAPELRFGEAYIDGTWEPDGCSLLNVLEVVLRGPHASNPPGWRRRWRTALGQWAAAHNGRLRSRLNVERHYDHPFSLYEGFLDPDLNYSCAYFRDPAMDLAAAQQAKCAHIAAKLDLRPGARVLDIGCGWGGLAFHLAERHGAQVLGITLSPSQLEVAQQRAQQRGLGGRVSLRLQDYRDVTETFDAVVSVGMFEHVGRLNYGAFFQAVRQRLNEGGTALIHTIGRMDGPQLTQAWVRRHIFPGSHIPALSELAAPVEDSGLLLGDLEIWRLHYARTLAAWHENFQRDRARQVAAHGERFARMWEFYLQSAEAAFRWGGLAVFQLQLARDLSRLPLTRDYLYRESGGTA